MGFIIALFFILNGFLALSLTRSEEFPPNYPFYYKWSEVKNEFEKGYKNLPADSRSLQPNFLTAPTTENWARHSVANQDMIVVDVFNDMENGYFIDLAANEWKKGSNTYLLETFNHWKGACIEANPLYHITLLANRKCPLFVNPVSSVNNDKITFHLAGGYSGIVGNEFDNREAKEQAGSDLILYTVTLTTILDFVQAPPIIHYLSLDIEGAEYYAMKGFNFQKYTIYLLTIERPKLKLHYLLAKNGYLFVNLLAAYGECLYFHHSIPNFSALWSKYHQNREEADWGGEKHDYLLDPKWNGNITDYMMKAEESYQKHHHSLNHTPN